MTKADASRSDQSSLQGSKRFRGNAYPSSRGPYAATKTRLVQSAQSGSTAPVDEPGATHDS